MPEIAPPTPPTSPTDARLPAVSAGGTPVPGGTGFQDALADAVTNAALGSAPVPAVATTSEAAVTGATPTKSGKQSKLGAADATQPGIVDEPDEQPAGTPPAPATDAALKEKRSIVTTACIGDAQKAPVGSAGTIPDPFLGGEAPPRPSGKDPIPAIPECAEPDSGKGAAAHKGKGGPGHSGDAATNWCGNPAAAQIAPNACNPVLPVVALPLDPAVPNGPADGGGPAGTPPGGVRAKIEPSKPAQDSRDGPVPGASAAIRLPQAPPVTPDPTAKVAASLEAVVTAAAVAPAHPDPRAAVPATPVAMSPTPAHPPERPAAGQVAPAIVSLAFNPAGMHHLIVRLDPPDLGRVEVRMTRDADSSASVEIVVERPATLALLRQDAPALHQALSDAGVPSQGRSLTMQLGDPGGQQLTGQGGGGPGGWSPRRFGASSIVSRSEPLRFLTPRALRSALDITA